MFTLYRHSDIEWQLTPEDYPLVLSPDRAMDQVKKHYDLDQSHYNHFGYFELPERLSSCPQTWRRAQSGYVDEVYDTVKDSLRIGWLIGIDHMEDWRSFNNPFYVDGNGDLVCENPNWYDEWYLREIIDGYNNAVARRNGVKASPTQRIPYGGSSAEPEQHAQAARAINSKAAGRLLAAGGIYNGNIEGYAKTAQQLGGDAQAGYDQVLNETTVGAAIAITSVAAGLGLSGLGTTSEIGQLSRLAKSEALSPRELANAAIERYPKQYEQYCKLPDKNLEKAMGKHEKQIAEHTEYLNDLIKRQEHVPGWDTLTPQHQDNLMYHWQQDIKRHEAYRSIAEDILKERK
ncbi:hypothetical protein [Rahnella aquatilis]|uniref:hypothetical protein n=1 Tax=Rahnella aquatilis TaxID=34038 RepID=UPI0036509309